MYEMREAGRGVRMQETLKVEVVERLGSTAFLHCRLNSGEAVVAEQRETSARPGARVNLCFDIARARLFDTAGARLR